MAEQDGFWQGRAGEERMMDEGGEERWGSGRSSHQAMSEEEKEREGEAGKGEVRGKL